MSGCQELALSGTSDAGPINEQIHNNGIFRAILRMQINCGDKMMYRML